ncbi:MAG: geranylgeranylglyceryl/heptaprenylglyceryl phosphate synthase [Candidatus Korarchaeota archaeon]
MGKTWEKILEMINRRKALHATLLDPDPLCYTQEQLIKMAKISTMAGSDLIFIGGSTIPDSRFVEETVKGIKSEVDAPVLLFPGNLTGVAPSADAILFMSLLNSANPYFITEAQAISAPYIKITGLEAISMAYIVIEPGAVAGYIGWARPLPRNKPSLVAAYVCAAELMGFKMAYLEAGSGAENAVPPEAIKVSRKLSNIPIVVGGGLTTPEEVRIAVKAGASIIVQGTFVEKTVLQDGGQALREIINAMRSP